MAAPSFYIPVLLALLAPVPPVAAQRPRAEVRVAVLSSSTLVEDLLAGPALKSRFGNALGQGARARAALAPELSVGGTVPLRPGVRLNALLGWQPTTLQAEDGSGTRDIQDLHLLSGLLEAEFTARAPLVVSGAVGMLGYRSESAGLFSEGSDLAPLVRLGAGAKLGVAGQAVTVRALADLHRFGTPLLRTLGGAGGGVVRYGIQLGVVPGGAR